MIRIIPAIDIIDGKCVRLSEGDFERKKIYDQNPLNVARRFEDAGVTDFNAAIMDVEEGAYDRTLEFLSSMK